MSPITTFFGTATVHRVYCGIFQDHRYRYSLLRHPTVTGYKIATIYICFSSGNLNVAVLLKPTAINTSYCVDAIAVVEKNATICELFLSCIGGLDHRYRLLNFQPQNFPRFFSSSLLGFHFSHLSFSLSLFSNSQSQILAELHLLRHQHLHPSFHPRARQNHHPLCREHHHQLCAKNIIPIRMFFFFF